MTGESDIEIEIIRPVDDAGIREHVRHALTMGLPDMRYGADTGATLHIYANGPSTLDAPEHHPAMLLNGAIKTWAAQGKYASYWAACDPQEIVAGFLAPGTDRVTTYLVASRCHPAVFAKLKGKNVQLWHIDDIGASELPSGSALMPDAPSITLSAIFLARFMGFKYVHVYGWDGCYSEGKSHAYEQAHNREGDTMADIDGREFHTTLTWLAEMQDAVKMLNMLPDMDLTIHGDGMIKAALQPILDHMKGARDAREKGKGKSLSCQL